jgi:hypothetical protein
MSNIIEREFSMIEILVKTTYQIVVSKEKSFQSTPIGFGAGFFLNYKDNLFFLTADHNIHINDHEINERTGIDNYVCVLNNISDRETFTTMMTSIEGFYYMESFDVSKEDLNPQLFDVAISLVDKNKFEAPFVTDEDIRDENGNQIVSPKEQKFDFLEEHMIEPSTSDTYYVFGKIRPEFKGLFLHRDNTFKNDLRFVDKFRSYLLLNTKEDISDYEDWAGLSGSPVLNQEGKCIGVLCSVNEGTKSVFVKPFNELVPLLDTIILQEKMLKEQYYR